MARRGLGSHGSMRRPRSVLLKPNSSVFGRCLVAVVLLRRIRVWDYFAVLMRAVTGFFACAALIVCGFLALAFP